MFHRTRHRLWLTALAGLMTACGGGDSNDAGTPIICPSCQRSDQSAEPPGTVEGYWRGSGGGYDFGAVVLGDGSTFVAYSRAGVIEGLMVGKTGASGTSFAGSVTDYNGARLLVTPGLLQGTYSRNTSMSASATLGSLTVLFTAAYDPTYDTAMDLAGLAGVWSGSAASRGGLTTSTLSLAADGTFTGSTPLCSASGTLVPIADRKHPLRATVSFSGSACPLRGSTVSGVAIVSNAGATPQMLAAGVLADGTDGFFALLSK